MCAGRQCYEDLETNMLDDFVTFLRDFKECSAKKRNNSKRVKNLIGLDNSQDTYQFVVLEICF